jgi:hypothetical protein
MAKKIIIWNSLGGECEYVRSVCKLVDNTLTDADFDLKYVGTPGFVNDNLSNAIDYYRDNYLSVLPKPILVRPSVLSGSSGRDTLLSAYDSYPDVPVVTSFQKAGDFSGRPVPLVLDPDRLSPAVLVCGGLAGESDWFSGPGLDFVEPAYVQYVAGSTLYSNLPITTITNLGGGVARITSAFITFFSAVGYVLHISGVSGFANNINGRREITNRFYDTGTPANSYVDVSFDLGAGAFSGPATAQIQFTSGAIAAAAAKLHKIMRARNCSFWEARYCAYMTGSESGVRSDTTGYGSIDESAAIAFDLSVPADPHDTLGPIGTLSMTIEDGVAVFTHPEVLNAKGASFYANDEIIPWIYTKPVNPGVIFWNREITYYHAPIKLGPVNYKFKYTRDSQATQFSNTVNTNILELSGKPSDPIYSVGQSVFYYNGITIVSSEIVEIFQTVVNPNNDNVGIETTEYLLADGASIVESKLGASRLDILSVASGGFYLNALAPLSISPFSFVEDLCGQDFRYTDFTVDGDYDFTDAIVSNTNFDNAILPAAYAGEVGLNLFLSQVAFCNKKTTIWVNGISIEEELEA